MRKLFIFGFGFSSEAIAAEAKPEFDEICGTSRSLEKVERLQRDGIESVLFDGERTDEIERHLKSATHIVSSVSPGENDPVLAAYPDICAIAENLEWVGYLSTVGVYGDHDGAWVDETTELKPLSKRSVQRVEAENAWLAQAENAQIPIAIFRLSGIYGPGRNWFINIDKGRSRRLVKKGQVFNRVHRDDIGAAVSAAIKLGADGIYNITDDNPAPPQDVVTLAHELMGKEPPPEQDFETADISAMARSFYGENKRVRNTKSKDVLKMNYAWPNYQTALKRLWEEGSWKAPA